MFGWRGTGVILSSRDLVHVSRFFTISSHHLPTLLPFNHRYHSWIMSRRYQPNIIITGTPGCGKTSHSESLASQLGKPYIHLPISDIAKQRDCIESYDAKLDTNVVDEDRLLDSLEEDLRKGGQIIDWHCCDIFPIRLIDLVIVLRTANGTLFDRLSKRGYKDNKIQENLDCEIMDVIVQDAREAYSPEIVIELESNEAEQMDQNVDRIIEWVNNWVKDHKEGVTNEIGEQPQESDEEEEEEEEEDDDEEDEDEEDYEEGDDDDDEEEYEEEEYDDDDKEYKGK